MSDATLRQPTERTCERCGRAEKWSEDEGTWQVVREDGEPQIGSLYCLHEWDINGSFVPVKGAADEGNA